MKAFEYQKLAFKDFVELGRNSPPDDVSGIEALEHIDNTSWKLIKTKNKYYYFKIEKI